MQEGAVDPRRGRHGPVLQPLIAGMLGVPQERVVGQKLQRFVLPEEPRLSPGCSARPGMPEHGAS